MRGFQRRNLHVTRENSPAFYAFYERIIAAAPEFALAHGTAISDAWFNRAAAALGLSLRVVPHEPIEAAARAALAELAGRDDARP